MLVSFAYEKEKVRLSCLDLHSLQCREIVSSPKLKGDAEFATGKDMQEKEYVLVKEVADTDELLSGQLIDLDTESIVHKFLDCVDFRLIDNST